MALLVLLFINAFIHVALGGDYYNMQNVLPLYGYNFNQSTAVGRWLVIFFRHSCGTCQVYSEFFEKAALYFQKWKDILSIGAIDCELDVNRNTCRSFELDGVPSLRYIMNYGKEDAIVTPVTRALKMEALRNAVRLNLLNDHSNAADKDSSSVWNSVFDDTGEISIDSIKVTSPPDLKTTKITKPVLTKVYADDIFRSLSMMLHDDVSMLARIAGNELEALKEFLSMLIKVLPCSEAYRSKLISVYDWTSNQTEFTGSEWANTLTKMQLPEFTGDFVACKGSSPKFRGYPCGLWTLFHSLTVEHYRKSLKDQTLKGDLVAHALNRFVPRFFSCLVCSFHFAMNTMNIARPGESILPDRESPGEDQFKFDPNIKNLLPKAPETAKEEVMWLNKLHNRVNQRLHGQSSEDPSAPKIQYPPRELCYTCWSSPSPNKLSLGGTLTTDRALFNFLLRHFGTKNWEVINVSDAFFETSELQEINDDIEDPTFKVDLTHNVTDQRLTTLETEYPDLFTVATISVVLSLVAVIALLILSRFIWKCKRSHLASYKRGRAV